jgi:hypothetical protein
MRDPCSWPRICWCLVGLSVKQADWASWEFSRFSWWVWIGVACVASSWLLSVHSIAYLIWGPLRWTSVCATSCLESCIRGLQTNRMKTSPSSTGTQFPLSMPPTLLPTKWRNKVHSVTLEPTSFGLFVRWPWLFQVQSHLCSRWSSYSHWPSGKSKVHLFSLIIA